MTYLSVVPPPDESFFPDALVPGAVTTPTSDPAAGLEGLEGLEGSKGAGAGVAAISSSIQARLVADPDTVAAGVKAMRECVLAWESYRLHKATFLGISVNDSTALSYLVSRGPLSITELQTALDFTNGATSLLVDRLEAKGMVRRLPDPNDRRKHIVHIVEGPEQLLRQMSNWIAVVFADLSTTEVEDTRRTLALVGQRLHDITAVVTATPSPTPAPRRRH